MRVLVACLSVTALSWTAAVSATPAKSGHSSAGTPVKEVVVSPQGATTTAKSPPDFGKIMAMFDKLFPPQPDPDPARLALARTSGQALWPDGQYGRLMTGFMASMFDHVMQMKPSDLAKLSDKPGKTDASNPDKDLSLHDQAVAKDPYFDQRMAAIRDVAVEETGKLSAILDPRIRDGLSRSMARRFDERQLADINGFFSTPSGRAFAAQYVQLWIDPDMMRSFMGTLPEMMKLMPDMMQKMKVANDRFPKPPKPAAPSKK